MALKSALWQRNSAACPLPLECPVSGFQQPHLHPLPPPPFNVFWRDGIGPLSISLSPGRTFASRRKFRTRSEATRSQERGQVSEASSTTIQESGPSSSSSSHQSTRNGTLVGQSQVKESGRQVEEGQNGAAKRRLGRDRSATSRPRWLDRGGNLWEQDVVKHEPRTISEYLVAAQDLRKCLDGGPPRWFCPLAARPPMDALPVMFFIPGIDGTGLGLLHQELSLGRYFELRCLSIPTTDRTTFDGLVNLVSDALVEEGQRSPGKPLYMIAESFGVCVALVAAARNPDLFLHLVLVNPATSFERSELQPVLPLLGAVPDALFSAVPYLFSYIMGDPVRMASAGVDNSLPYPERMQKIANRMTSMLPELPLVAEILPKATLMWKLKLLAEGSPKANAVLKDVKAQTLLVASGKDQMLPSKEEAKRLAKLMPHVSIRNFPDSGHTLLLEDGVEIASMIKGSRMYKRSKKDEDPVFGFFPPTAEEFQRATESTNLIRQVTSPVFFSTNNEGRVERGLGAVPTSGPILFVGNHQLIGIDLPIVVGQMLKEKSLLVRGLAHPGAMGEFRPLKGMENEDVPMVGRMPDPFGMGDLFRTFGAVSVTGSNMYKLLADGEAVLLFPGGVREALKRKGEAYKLFWPERSEFVRMAVYHGATIVPFAVVGIDDSVEILLDSTEVKRVPYLGENAIKFAQLFPRVRENAEDEEFITPIIFPKLPSRQYMLFQKPIITKGLADEGFLKDLEKTEELYLHTKREVEAAINFLLTKRKEDPYNDFVPRILYETTWGGKQAPTFKLP